MMTMRRSSPLLLTPASIPESGTGNTSTLTASLNRISAEDTTLTITAAPGTDTLAGDYTLAGTTLTIAAGDTDSSGTVTVTAVDNAVDAPDKSVLVSATIASSAAGIATPATVTLTITDDDGAPLVPDDGAPPVLNEQIVLNEQNPDTRRFGDNRKHPGGSRRARGRGGGWQWRQCWQ